MLQMDINNCQTRAYDQKDMTQDVVSLVDEMLHQAARWAASDVHFEPTETELVVKFRLDGALKTVEKLPKSLSENVIARLKVLGGLLTYRTDIPQEGRIDISGTADTNITDQRLAVFPTIHGQRAVVRLFYKQAGLVELEQLGFPERIRSALMTISAASQGLLLVTGPAGSGKSTTLAAILRYILVRFPGKSVVTLEDPVEIKVEGATQVQITPHGQMTFPTALRSLLRQDPQILMIGEIRDAETARIVIEAGLTGHLLMSTMHSGTPAGAILRLLEMGIEPYQVTSSICAVLNQRLVRRLCERCKRTTDKGVFQAVGCETCFETGYKGRVLIAEMVELDSCLRKAILAKADLEELEHLLKQGGHTNMLDDGRRLVESGVTTQEEVNKVCPGVSQSP